MMLCPKCGCEKTHTFDNAFNPETNESYRRRRCTECSHAFFTVEFEVEETEQFGEDWKKWRRAQEALAKEKKQRLDKKSRNKRNEPGRNRCAKCKYREHMGGPCCEGCEALAARKNTIGKLFNKE